MFKIFSLLVGLCFTNYSYSASTEIPNQFHGFWATKEGCRQMNKEGIDAPSVEIKKSEINMPFNSCKVKSVKKSDAQLFEGQFNCRGEEGEMSKSNIEILLSNTSNLSVKNNDELKNLSICKFNNRK